MVLVLKVCFSVEKMSFLRESLDPTFIGIGFLSTSVPTLTKIIASSITYH